MESVGKANNTFVKYFPASTLMFFNVGVKGGELYNLLSENKEFRNTVSIAKADEVKELFGTFQKDMAMGLINFTMDNAPTFLMYASVKSATPVQLLYEKKNELGLKRGEDILKQVVHCFLSGKEKQKTLLIPKFSWWYYKSIADEVEGRSVLYPLYEEGNTFKYDFEAMKEAIRKENPEMVLIASPNNPTGNSLTSEELDQILSFISPETVVVIDEAYASFANKDTSYIKPLLEKFPNLLIVRTLSKFYGLPGLRLGFAFMGTALTRFLNYSTKYLGYNRLSEELGIAVLKSTDYYQQVADQMAEDRQMYMNELNTLEGFKVYQSNANFILVKYPIELKATLQAAFKAKGYQIKFMNEPDINTHMRITLGTHRQNVEVIATIKEVVAQ